MIVKMPHTKRPSKVDIDLHKTGEEKKQERKRKTTMYLEKKTPCYISPMNNSYFSAAYIEHLGRSRNDTLSRCKITTEIPLLPATLFSYIIVC